LLEKTENTVITFSNLSGFAKKRPLMSFCLTIFLLSLAGIPPTVGFFGKFYLFSAAISEGLIWLAIWGVLNSVISVYYYLRPIVHMYMQDGDADEAAPLGMFSTRAVIFVFAVLVVVFGIFSGPLFTMMEAALS
jgi:NADH-quinone oxidoreductase subunit N